MENSDQVSVKPVCDASAKPYVGQVFRTLDEGVNFYREYAKLVGFDTRLSSSKKVNDILTWRYVVCNREGEKFVAADNDMLGLEVSTSNVRRRISSRCGCNARIIFKYVAYQGYLVHAFVEEHNHDLVELSHREFMKVNRNIDIVHQRFILDCAASNIGPTASHRLLSEIMGGTDFVGCSVLEVRNFSRDMKAFANGCDAQMLLNDMKKKKELCEAFTYNYEVDAEDKLARLFWCDPISRRNFQLFGHSVAFDTTYSTNKYCMIFAPFTGKDNHGKLVTFAAGLLTKEDAASFAWLFQNFVDCMGYAPKLIITDQDLGMKVAVERVLKGTRHRWCMWHIMLKVADKISKELRAEQNFKKELNACVWSEVIDPEFFDASWGGIMSRYGLIGDTWLTTMFENRKYWVPAYFREFPLSGLLRTTSISECENSFYKKYTRSRSNLLEFWMQFNHALDAQRHQNAKLNYLDKSFFPCLKTDLDIEKNASRVYSANFFRKVQDEIKDCQKKVALHERLIADGKETYKLVDDLKENFIVVYDVVGDDYLCSCKLFERMGYFCKHVFFVMKNKFVSVIPEKYFLERWKKVHLMKNKQVFDAESLDRFVAVDQCKSLTNRMTAMFYGWMQQFDGDVCKLSDFMAAIDLAGKNVSGMEKAVQEGDKRQMIQKFYGAEIPEKVDVHPPDVVKTKGSGTRIISNKEKAIRETNKHLRLCRKCKKMATHDSRNCDKFKDAGSSV